MAVLSSLRASAYGLNFKKQNFEDFKKQARIIKTIESNDILGWSKRLNPIVKKNIVSKAGFAKQQNASLIAKGWVNTLGTKVFAEKIKLSSEDIELFTSVKIAFETLSQTYDNKYYRKYGNELIKDNTREFRLISKNYINAAKDLNLLITPSSEKDKFEPEHCDSDSDRDSVAQLKDMFQRGKEEEEKDRLNPDKARQEKLDKQSERLGLDPREKKLTDTALKFCREEGFLTGDFDIFFK